MPIRPGYTVSVERDPDGHKELVRREVGGSVLRARLSNDVEDARFVDLPAADDGCREPMRSLENPVNDADWRVVDDEVGMKEMRERLKRSLRVDMALQMLRGSAY